MVECLVSWNEHIVANYAEDNRQRSFYTNFCRPIHECAMSDLDLEDGRRAKGVEVAMT